MSYETYFLPVEENIMIYRPLRRLAFVGNQRLAEMIEQLVTTAYTDQRGIPDRVLDYLQAIGFDQPDSALPPFPDREFHPLTAVFLLTNRCNLRCTYCYANAGVNDSLDLTMEKAVPIIDQVCDEAMALGSPVFYVSFHGGGEPTQLWSVIKDITAYARQKPIAAHISMVSNGIWSDAQCQWILQNLNEITISFDGSPQTQDRQRPLASGAGSSRYVLQTLAALDEVNFPYSIRLTATAPWGEQLVKDVRYLCENTACRNFHVEPAFNTERGIHQLPASTESQAFIDGYVRAYALAQRHGRTLAYSGVRLGMVTRQFCTAPYDALIVNPQGHLVTCYEIADDQHSMAALSTIGHVAAGEIELNTDNRNQLLDYLEDKQATQCAACFAQWHCAGDCYVRSSSADGGHFQAHRTRCDTHREITRRLLLWHIEQGDGLWQGMNANPVDWMLVQAAE